MIISAISFSTRGYDLSLHIKSQLEEAGYKVHLYTKSRYTAKCPEYVAGSLHDWCSRQFAQADALLFLSSCGIAVRTIAPYVQNKKYDPAVLVMDDTGKYVISLLSGHLGGANGLADALGRMTGAQPVITTATERNGKLAVDVFAARNHLYITDMQMAKRVSAAVLQEEPVGFYSDLPWDGELPQELVQYTEEVGQFPRIGIVVTLDKAVRPYEECLYLLPRSVILGIGCRRGISCEQIETAVEEACGRLQLPIEVICRVASIDVKAQEPGILAFCRKHNLEFATCSAQELNALEGEFTQSAFVQSRVGVDNVCERSALLLSGQGKLLLRKQAAGGVTVALAMKKGSVHFE